MRCLMNRALVRVVTAAAMACTLMLGPLSSASSPSDVTLSSESCLAGGYTQIDGKCMQIVHNNTTLAPAASAALQEAFATPTGRAALLKVFKTLGGAKTGVVQSPAVQSGVVQTLTYVTPAWNCPGGASCGVSSSGGWHFWFIASYAAIYDVGAFPFWLACTGALSPIIDPVAATLACGAVTGIIWALVNNAPWTTRHGVWMAVYWNHISDGFW
jgi:hypothetical protein